MKKMKQIFTFLFFIISAPIVFSQAADECNIKYNLFKNRHHLRGFFPKKDGKEMTWFLTAYLTGNVMK